MRIPIEDSLQLFYLKFNVDLPHKNENFNIINFTKIFNRFIFQFVNLKNNYNYEETSKELLKNKFMNFECLDKGEDGFVIIFKIIKNNKPYYSLTAKMLKEDIEMIDLYNSKIKKMKFFRMPEDINLLNYTSGLLFLNEDIQFEFKNTKKLNNPELIEEYLSVNFRNEDYILEKNVLDENGFNSYTIKNLLYFYKNDFKVERVQYNLLDYNCYILINYDIYSKKYYLINEKSFNSHLKDISINAVNYLNESNKMIEDITNEDMNIINLVAY